MMPRPVSYFLTLLVASSCPLAHAQCTASPEVRTELEAYAAAGRGSAPQADRKAAQKKVLNKALADHPNDPFLLDRERDWFDDNTRAGREAASAFFAALHEKYPDVPAITALYARSLHLLDSAQTRKLLEESEKAHPGDPWAHTELLSVYLSGKSRDLQRLAKEIDAYFDLCPAPEKEYIYRILTLGGSPEQMVRYASLLRNRLQAASGEPDHDLWIALWNLEFKAAPPASHPAVRERIRKDLARFEALPSPAGETRLTLLLQGYELLGDDGASANRIEARIVENFPDSRDAERIVTRNWDSEHPFPRGGDHAAEQAWYRLSAVAAHAWYERWHDTTKIQQEFNAKSALDETTPDELLAVAHTYVEAYWGNPNSFYAGNPIEFDVADALIKKKALPAEIPAWLNEGFRRENNRPSRLLGVPREELSDENKAGVDRQIASMRIERARILLDYYDALGQPGKARGIEDQLSGLHPAEERLLPELQEVLAHAALMDNRKLDALMYYRAARDLGGRQSRGGITDAGELDKKIDLLYQELGGTQSTLALFNSKGRYSPVSAVRWEAPKNPLPAFSLTDLGGKVWSLADLKGVAILVNVWATWCGPCREEHPQLEKLYERVKDRKDIAVLSVSVDEEAGLVAPYMNQHKYTFPVVLGRDMVDAVAGSDGSGIPQNWLISPAGKLETVEFGYGAEPDWLEVMLGKLLGLANKPN